MVKCLSVIKRRPACSRELSLSKHRISASVDTALANATIVVLARYRGLGLEFGNPTMPTTDESGLTAIYHVEFFERQ